MSELIREYPAHFFDQNKFKKKDEGEAGRKAEDELHLTLNPTSLLVNNNSLKPRQEGRHQHDSILSSNQAILSSNRSATADFLNPPAQIGPYGQTMQTQKSGGSLPSSMMRKNNRGDADAILKSSNKKTKEYFFKLGEAIVFLKRQGYPLEGTNVSFYSSIFSAFVNCDMDPVGDFVHISEKHLEIIDNTPSLRLRFDKGSQAVCRYEEDSSEKEDEDNSIQGSQDYGATARGNKINRVKSSVTNDSRSEMNQNNIQGYFERPKTKERTVAYVIQKVTQWRRLYNGYYDKDFNHQRLSLEDAADQVGVSKKSLDDYLSQLRSGRQCGYDFNTFKNEKVGHLRKFVKDH